MLLSFKESLALSAGSGTGTRKIEARARACASVGEEFGPYSVQECEDVFCCRDGGAVGEDDRRAMVENAVSLTEGEAEKTEVESRLEKGKDGEVNELYFGIARDV